MLNLYKFFLTIAMMCIFSTAKAEIHLSTDWLPPPSCIKVGPQPSSPTEQSDWLGALQRGERKPWFECPKGEMGKMRIAADAMCVARNSSTDKIVGQPHYNQYFMLYADGAKYYMQGAMFMSKTSPNERCTPVDKDLVYLCEQGQRFKESAHLLFMDSNFQDAGVYKVKINTPYDVFVNAMLALGIANKTRNELLLTVQYFAIDGKGAHTISEVGDGWKRMTVLLRLKAVDGKIEVEQDDSCLGNPNNYETIPNARKALMQCVAKKHTE